MQSRNTMKRNRLLIFIFIITTIISILIRPNIFTTKIEEKEWNLATTLRHISIWDSTNPWNYYFNPIVTYPTPSNQFIDNNASQEIGKLVYFDSKGNYYYSSYPQFTFIANYLFSKIFFGHPSPLSVRVFGLIIHILTALLVYKILVYITRKKDVGAIGYISYMLMPITVLYHTNMMSDMFVQVFFMSTAYLFIKLINENTRKIDVILFVLSMFLMIYTEYLGICVAGFIFIYGLFNIKKPFSRVLIWTSLITPIVAMSLVIYQYTLVGNFNSFIAVIIDRYFGSYQRNNVTIIKEIIGILNNYWSWYSPAIILIIILLTARYVISMTIDQGSNVSVDEYNKIKGATAIILIPILIHHTIFIHWTNFHSVTFSLLKSAPLISIMLGLSFWYLIHKTKVVNKDGLKNISLILFIVCLAFFIKRYNNSMVQINPYSLCDTGIEISKYAKDDQVIFLNDSRLKTHKFPIQPSLITCANRNMEIYKDKKEALELIKKNNAKSGVVFTLTYFLNEGVNITNIKEI